MKTLIISLTLVLLAGLSQAQVIKLDEAKVGFDLITLQENTFLINIKENKPGEFEKDPVVFMKNNFDMKEFLSLVQKKKVDLYYVNFRNRKGMLKAEFDKEGNLLKTSQRFDNIRLPLVLSHQLYRDYKGWTMTKNTHLTSGKEDKKEQDTYLITLINGKQKKNLKIDFNNSGGYVVAYQ